MTLLSVQARCTEKRGIGGVLKNRCTPKPVTLSSLRFLAEEMTAEPLIADRSQPDRQSRVRAFLIGGFMPDAYADFLADLSVKELLALQALIHEAVRARIRERNQAKAQPPASSPTKPFDLERERDAWLAARRSSGVRLVARGKP